MWYQLILSAKPRVEELIGQQLPGEFRYFEPLWAALDSWLASEKDIAVDGLHKPIITTLAFADGFAHPAQRSVEVIATVAECTRIFADGTYPGDDAIRTCVLHHTRILHSDSKLLEAIVQVVSGILTVDRKPSCMMRIDFLTGKVQLSGILLSDRRHPRIKGPWRLLEHLLWHSQEDVHWICGFFLFSEWQKEKTLNFRKSFGEHRSRLEGKLNSPDRPSVLELNHAGGSYVRLVRWSFESNVPKAKAIYAEASQLFNDSNYEDAAKKAAEAIELYPRCEKARMRLAACYIAKDCRDVTASDAEAILKHLSHQHKLLLGAIQCASELPEDVFIEGEATVHQWRIEAAQIAVLRDGIRNWLEKKGITFEGQLDCYRFMDKLEQLLQSRDKETQRSLWQKIAADPVYAKAKRRFVRMFESRVGREITPDEESEFDSYMVSEKSRIAAAEKSTPAELASYIGITVYYSWLEKKLADSGLSSVQQKQVRTLWRQREQLRKELERDPTSAELCKAIGCEEWRLQEILKWERGFRSGDYRESAPSDDET